MDDNFAPEDFLTFLPLKELQDMKARLAALEKIAVEAGQALAQEQGRREAEEMALRVCQKMYKAARIWADAWKAAAKVERQDRLSLTHSLSQVTAEKDELAGRVRELESSLANSSRVNWQLHDEIEELRRGDPHEGQ